MEPAPERKREDPYMMLKGSKELAEEHFGTVEGLLIADAKKIELAKYYADKHGLDFKDPDVVATATLKAWTRFREFALIQASEKKVYEQVVASGLSYEEALYEIIQSDRQRRVLTEIRRLHEQGRSLNADLKALVE